jgi:uncharacterized protein with von Willebrand factor type A (vWA) domain
MVSPGADSSTDLASLAARFTALLRAGGVSATPAQAMRFARSVRAVDPRSLTDLYWTARITLVVNRADIPVFDRVFAQVFRGLPDPGELGESRGDPNARRPTRRGDESRVPQARTHRTGTPGGSFTAGPDAAADHADDGSAQARPIAIPTLASDVDRLSSIDFRELRPHEVAQLAVLMRRLKLTPPLRRGRRSRHHPHGDRLDLRATLRRGPRTGGDPVRPIRRRKLDRARRVVVLCDISGSMEAYSRAYVQFLHANANANTAGPRTEVFTFATRLTRLTKPLAGSQPQLALDRAAAAAPDWRGGTRIGEAVRTFLDTHGRKGMARGAVVVILSDGWERDDPAQLAEQMARLRRLAHRVVWVNPRSADAGYEPVVGGMAAALPHCDEFLSGHSFSALGKVVEVIAASSRAGSNRSEPRRVRVNSR